MFSRSVRVQILVLIFLLLGASSAVAADNVANSRGFDPEKVFQFGSVDHVNVMTGNVMLTIPLGQRYTVSPALQYGFTLAYNSKVWEIFPGLPARGQANDRANAGLGWTMNLGKLWDAHDSESPSPGWFWESPDGGDHRFWLTDEDHVYVTKDGSYLRLRKNNLKMELDFPNGVTHVYGLIGDTEKWRLEKMYDRFKLGNGTPLNFVDFTYQSGYANSKCSPVSSLFDTEVWFIEDSHDRKHQVCLAERPFDGKDLMMVEEVHLDVFSPDPLQRRTAKYDLKYGDNPLADLVQLPCLGVLFEDQTQIRVTTLHEVVLPDGSSYKFEYHMGTSGMPAYPCDQGAISEMTLPTGGTTEWEYQAFFLPSGTGCGYGIAWGSHNVAVKTKTVRDAQAAEIGTWTYAYDLTPQNATEYDCFDPEPPGPPPPRGITPPEEMKVTITGPSLDRTDHYFSVWPGKNERDPAPASIFIPSEHGLPFTRRVEEDGRFLSSEVFDCDAAGANCVSLRKTYVKYEQDETTPNFTEWNETRRRLKAERTYTGSRYRDMENDLFDGFGHFRKSEITSNAGDPTRTTFTNFLPGSNEYGLDANGLPYLSKSESWLTGLYDETWVEEDNGDGDTTNDKMRTLVCFDTVTGFLKGRRTLRDATDDDGDHDVLTLFQKDTFGNVAEESSFGGDTQDVSEMDHCAYSSSGAQYRLAHAYSFGSVSETTVFKTTGGVLLKPVRRTIDRATGLARTSTDPADVVTTYDYDSSGRLLSVESTGSATTSYAYNNFSATGPTYASVVVTVDSADAENDTEQTVEFDSFGRVVRETRDMLTDPEKGSSIAVRKTEYDEDGRKERVSMWERNPTHYTVFAYDALGRTTKVTTPDNKVGTFTYDGDKSVTRTAEVGTVYDAANNETDETVVAVTESRDVQGRLVKVEEGRPVTTTNGQMTFGTAEVTTTYKYDVGGRLTDVAMTGKDMEGTQRTQTRSFDYEPIGFLTKETHPESGDTTYRQFDAKGHARYVDQGAARDIFDLELEYDEGERQTKVLAREALDATGYRTMKEFVYDETNAHGNSAGKLATAIRHNYTSFGDIVVTETFHYGDAAGRLTSKTTKIENATTNTVFKEVTQGVDYNDLGLQKTVTYPTCASCGTPNWASITNTYQKGYLQSIAGFVDSITYHPNGLYDTITHAGSVNVKDIQVPDPTGLPRPERIYTSGGVTCQPPTISNPPASQTIPQGTSTQLTVTAANVTEYKWYQGPVGDRSTRLGGNFPFLDTPDLHVATTFWVELFNACGSVQSAAAVVSVMSCGSSTFTITATPAVVSENQPFQLTAPSIPNTTYRWFRGTHASSTLLETTSVPTHNAAGITAATSYFVEMSDAICNVTPVRSQVLTMTPCLRPAEREIESTKTTNGFQLTIEETEAGVTYEWYQGANTNDLSKPLGTGSSIIVNPVAPTSYWVRMTRTCGDVSVYRDTPFLLIDKDCEPSIFIRPQPASAVMPAPGGSVSLSTTVVAGGVGPFTYKWYEVLPGADLLVGEAATFTWDYSIPQGSQGPPLGVAMRVYVEITACGQTVKSDTVQLSVARVPQKFFFYSRGDTVYRSSHPARLSVSMDPQPGPQHNYEYEWYQDDGTPNGRLLDVTGDDVEVAPHNGPGIYWVKVTGYHSLPPDPQGNIHEFVEVTTSPHMYVNVYGECELPPLKVSQSVSNITPEHPADSVSFLAFCDWEDVTYTWYRGQSGDTRDPIDADPGMPNLLTVNSSPVSAYWVRATSDCGAYRDSDTLIYVKNGCTPVIINQNVPPAAVAWDGSTTLTVTGSPSLDYTWYEGTGTGTIKGTNAALVLQNIRESARYWARVEDDACNTSSDTFLTTVRVASAPSINPPVWQPEVWTDKGTAKTLVATSEGATGYEWYEGELADESHPASGGTLSTYVTPVLNADAKYWVRVKGANSHLVDSPTIHVKVCEAPVINEGHLDFNIVPNQNIYIGVNALAGTNLRYQWYVGPAGTTTTPIGRPVDKLLIGPSATTQYWVRVSAACGVGGSDLRSVDSETYTVSVCPTITADPTAAPATVMPNATTQVSVTATGTGLTYQWYIGESGYKTTPVAGGTTPTITTPPITGTTKFWCEVKSGECARNSDTVTVSLCSKPTAHWQHGDKFVKKGQQVDFFVAADGGGEEVWMTFYKGPAGNVAGSTVFRGPTLYNFSAVVEETAQYWARAVVNNCYGDTTNITVNVCIPQITTHPAGGNITSGATKTLTVATDIAAAGYQWYVGETGDISTPVAGATSASVTVSPTADTRYWVRVRGCGSSEADSTSALVTVCTPPAITNQPVSGWITLGTTRQLQLGATGTDLVYRWYRGNVGDTTNVIGNSHSVFVNPTNTTTYWARVSNGCGSVDSAAITVSVCAVPAITQQPLSQRIFSGKTATLSVTATQATNTPMTYQWYTGATSGSGTAIAGATSPTYTTPALTADASYWVRIKADQATCQVDSAVATVSMCAYSEVLNAPADKDISLGQTVRLDVLLSPVPQAGKWYRGAQGDKTNPISNYTFADVSPTVTTQYWAEFTHDNCVAKTRTVTVFVSIPTITTQPTSVQVNANQTATLTVAANTAGLTYQWHTGATSGSGTPISGATSASYTTPPMTATTTYWAKITGSRGHVVNSNTATVTVCAPAAITAQPQPRSIQKGATTTLSVTATGTNVTYQWYMGAAGVTTSPAGNTASINVAPTVPRSYWVRVTSDCGTVNSNVVQVDVCATPAITQQPLSQNIFSGHTATLSVAATQETGLAMTYQWYAGTSGGGTPISGATSTTYTTPALTATANYWVKITSGVCNVNSNTATVSMCAYNEVINAPADRDISLGQTVRLDLNLSPVPQSGKWYRGAQGDRTNPISNYTFADVSPTVTTQYWGEYVHDGCAAKTRTVTVFVSIPTITTQPAANTQVNGGQTATLTVVANTAGLTYQWYSGASGGGTPISGATGATYVVPAQAAGTTASFWVKVTGSRGHVVNSNTAAVLWCNPAAITQQPQNRSIRRGYSASLTTSATGTNIRYQWYNGTSGTETSPVNGATTDTLTVTPTVPKQYWVKAISDCGSQNSNTANVDVCIDPTINTQPANTVVYSGTSATLSVVATAGTALPLTYQWYTAAGAAISGATSASYTTPALTSPASYYVRITSGVCSIDSTVAAVTICAYGPTVNGPSDRNSSAGAQVQLRAIISPVPQSGKWYRGVQGDRTNLISNATIHYVYPTVTTQYWAEFTHDGCTTMTRTVTVNICIPTIQAHPQDVSIWAGQTTTLSVTATQATSYQWYQGDYPINGATSSTYTTPPLYSTETYSVRVTGSCGNPVDSQVATVTVN